MSSPKVRMRIDALENYSIKFIGKKFIANLLFWKEPIELFIESIKRQKFDKVNTQETVFLYKDVKLIYKYFFRKKTESQRAFGLGVIRYEDGRIFYDFARNPTQEQIAVHSALLDVLNKEKL